MVFATMGSNFGDFDNDGFLDFYLGTGDPNLATLVPNRMFKNVAGSASPRSPPRRAPGNLQKGHGVACGDWDRDGDVDIFIEMGGAVNGDKYHNILFQNPGHGNHWLTVKLVGKRPTARPSAPGSRSSRRWPQVTPLPLRASAGGGTNRTAMNSLSTATSPPEAASVQTRLSKRSGLARPSGIERLEIHWPTSGTTQVFRDVAVNQAIEVTEFAEDYRKLERPKIDWETASKP